MKKCFRCKQMKPLDQFHSSKKNNVDGRASSCKECSNSGKSRDRAALMRKQAVSLIVEMSDEDIRYVMLHALNELKSRRKPDEIYRNAA